MLVVLGISKLGRDKIDFGAVGIEELDTIPPPPPPVDVILDKPTIIGFLPGSLRQVFSSAVKNGILST